MNIVDYLSKKYGYDNPILIKDIRIPGKKKSAIREEISRAYKKGDLARLSVGVYSVNKLNNISDTSFEDILNRKFLFSYDKDGNEIIEGYYSGKSFLHIIGILIDPPKVVEVTTNKVTSKKSKFKAIEMEAIIRKGRTFINQDNYKILQFLDMFHFLNKDEIKENKELLISYIEENQFSMDDFKKYVRLYGVKATTKLVESSLINAFIRINNLK